MLRSHQISCQRGKNVLWEGLDLEIGPGELLFIKGANGQGKSSLLRILAGLATPNSGSVTWDHVLIQKITDTYYPNLLYLGHIIALQSEMSAVANLQFLMRIHGHNIPQQAIHNKLFEWGLSHKTIQLPTRLLSQGQKQRVALTQLSLSQSSLWILDEPFNGLDQMGTEHLYQTMLNHLQNKGFLILTSHLHQNFQHVIANDPAVREKIITL